MRRKALLKTLYDILKIIGKIIGYIAVCGTGFYLLVMIPIWFLNLFDLTEKCANYPAGFIYSIELLVFLFIILLICGIRELYINNLEESSSQ